LCYAKLNDRAKTEQNLKAPSSSWERKDYRRTIFPNLPGPIWPKS